MNIDYNVREYEYDKRDGNLTNEAKSEVKSKKFFPYFYEDGKKKIFKPLYKTKPLSTPYFAYSEVVWSHILNAFFDPNIPLYHLAKCHGYEENNPRYHDCGTVVESIVTEQERLVNIYEYFMTNREESVSPIIDGYINYCLEFYDYTHILQSEFFKNNKSIGYEFAKQYLYSLLRIDQNFHYENISLIYEGNELKSIAKPIDHEFSTMFMYLDKDAHHLNLYGKFITTFIKYLNQGKMNECGLFDDMEDKVSLVILNNIKVITKLYPELVEEFINSLNNMMKYLCENPIILEDHNYIVPFDSDEYEVGNLRYNMNKEQEALAKEKKLKLKLITTDEVNKYLTSEILNNSKYIKLTLEKNLS